MPLKIVSSHVVAGQGSAIKAFIGRCQVSGPWSTKIGVVSSLGLVESNNLVSPDECVTSNVTGTFD
jgi:hypothetical protein